MSDHQIIPLKPEPGIQRDGTKFDSKSYIDGQWVRFYRGMPRKIGGYELLSPGTEELIRTLYSIQKPSSFDLYLGRSSGVNFISYFISGSPTPETDRTPAGYASDVRNLWMFDQITNIEMGGIVTYIVAHVAPNAFDITNSNTGDISGTSNTNIFYGKINESAALQPIAAASPVSGGIVSVPPFLFAYDNGGVVSYSADNDFLTWPTENINVIGDGTKIVLGKRVRGGATPSVLFWSLGSLVRATFVSLDVGFTYETISENISIVSPRSVVEFDQVFYWIGSDQFYFYNGIVQTLQNTYSTNYFFDNLNKEHLSKIFGVSNRRHNEIWFFYPRGSSTECNAVLIYNVKEQVFYDSFMPRSHAIPANLYSFPIMADSSLITNIADRAQPNTYGVWTHEKGYDQVAFNRITAIESYIESNIITLPDLGGEDKQVRIRRIEPDFVQVGNMSATIRKRAFASSEVVESQPFDFTPNTEKIDMAEMSRLVSIKFSSNDQNGDFRMGKVLLNIDAGDRRP